MISVDIERDSSGIKWFKPLRVNMSEIQSVLIACSWKNGIEKFLENA